MSAWCTCTSCAASERASEKERERERVCVKRERGRESEEREEREESETHRGVGREGHKGAAEKPQVSFFLCLHHQNFSLGSINIIIRPITSIPFASNLAAPTAARRGPLSRP